MAASVQLQSLLTSTHNHSNSTKIGPGYMHMHKNAMALKYQYTATRLIDTQRKPSHAATKLMFFTVSKDEWNTKEESGKSLKNALDVLRYANKHLSG